MSMKSILVTLILAVLALGGYFLLSDRSETGVSGPDNTAIVTDSVEQLDATADVTVDVSGKNFEFSVTEIRVSEGDVVTINFESESGFHDWVVDEFKAASPRVRDGEKTSVTFVADRAGIYEYYCSVGEHRANGMVGTLIVE